MSSQQLLPIPTIRRDRNLFPLNNQSPASFFRMAPILSSTPILGFITTLVLFVSRFLTSSPAATGYYYDPSSDLWYSGVTSEYFLFDPASKTFQLTSPPNRDPAATQSAPAVSAESETQQPKKKKMVTVISSAAPTTVKAKKIVEVSSSAPVPAASATPAAPPVSTTSSSTPYDPETPDPSAVVGGKVWEGPITRGNLSFSLSSLCVFFLFLT